MNCDGFPRENKTIADGRQLRRDRVRIAKNRGTHTAVEWSALLVEFEGRCVRCGREVLRMVKDHIVPIYKGGDDTITNIQPLCHSCNSSKGPEQTDWKEYRRAHGW